MKRRRSTHQGDDQSGPDSLGKKCRKILQTAKLSKGVFGFNLVVLLLTLLIVYSNDRALGGLVDLVLMTGALGLSMYAIYLMVQGAVSWQVIRLAFES